MVLSIFVFFLTVCLALNCVDSNPIEGQASFVEGLNIRYENGTWICGDLKCPSETTGCTIRIKSDEKNKTVLYQSFNCMDSIGAGDRIELAKEKSVDIEITSYFKAKSVFNIEYNDKDEEFADGFVPVENLKELKEKFKELKRLVNEEKKPVAVYTQSPHPGKKLDHSEYLYNEKLNSYKEQVSYVEGLYFKYEYGKWTCGHVECPFEATGCNIRIKSDEKDKKLIYQTINCNGTISVGNKIELKREKWVDIDISTYVGAVSAFTLKYNDDDEEVADGVVALRKLQYLKREFKELRKLVLEDKRGAALMTQGFYRGKY